LEELSIHDETTGSVEFEERWIWKNSGMKAEEEHTLAFREAREHEWMLHTRRLGREIVI